MDAFLAVSSCWCIAARMHVGAIGFARGDSAAGWGSFTGVGSLPLVAIGFDDGAEAPKPED